MSEGPERQPGHQVSSLPAACWTWYCSGTGDDRSGGTPWLSGLRNWHKFGPEPSTCKENHGKPTMRRQISKSNFGDSLTGTKPSFDTKPLPRANWWFDCKQLQVQLTKDDLKTGSKLVILRAGGALCSRSRSIKSWRTWKTWRLVQNAQGSNSSARPLGTCESEFRSQASVNIDKWKSQREEKGRRKKIGEEKESEKRRCSPAGCTAVARRTFWSQNAENTSCSEHFWELRCSKSARCCRAKHI